MPIQTGVINKKQNSLREGILTMPTHNKVDNQFSLKVEAVRALEFANRLHSTLDIDELFAMYSKGTRASVPFDHLAYTHPDDIYSFKEGTRKRHSCQYRLLMGGQNLGELVFTRSQKFSEAETMSLEYSLSSLLNPLHNSLLYHQAKMNSQIDPLTGIKNRSSFDLSISREISLSRRHDNPLAMIILDIDKFKEVNDTHGHLFGDCVLRDVAQSIKHQIRDCDMAFRYGGEEFVILLSNTGIKGAQLLAERIRKNVAKLECTYNGNKTGVTVSLGVACLNNKESETDFFHRADEALYDAKNNGRNCTKLAKI